MERIASIKKIALIINQLEKSVNQQLSFNVNHVKNILKNIYHFLDENIIYISNNDDQFISKANIINDLQTFVSRGNEWYFLYYIGKYINFKKSVNNNIIINSNLIHILGPSLNCGRRSELKSYIENDSEEKVITFNDILNIDINGNGNIFNLIPLGSRLTVWLDYYFNYEDINSKKDSYQLDEHKISLPNLSNYLYNYHDNENFGEYSLSVNTPGNIICFQSLSCYYPSSSPSFNKYENYRSALEIAFSELIKNPNISINQFTEAIINNIKIFKDENEIVLSEKNTNASNSYLYNHQINNQSQNLIKKEEDVTKALIHNDNLNINDNSLITEIPNSDDTTNALAESNHTTKIITIPKKISVYINKNYIKEETFIPFEKYKYKILKELVSTAHAQLYLVTEKNVFEGGGFSHSSLNLTLNSNSIVNYCDNEKESSVKRTSSNNELKPANKSLGLPIKHVLKVIYIAKDKNSLTVESEKKYKKTIKEALFLRELNHINIQKFITSWYCDQGTLKEYIMKKGIINKNWILDNGANPYLGPGNCLNEVVVRIFYKQLVSAIEYIHKKKIIHRDIKPQNIMLVQSSSSLPMKYYIDKSNSFEKKNSLISLHQQLSKVHIGWQDNDMYMKKSFSSLSNKSFENTNDNVNMNQENMIDIRSLIHYQYLPVLKIVDFGLAIYTKNNIIVNKGHVGTLQYMAPEIVNGVEASYNSDLWSIGATLYECMLFECPYRNRIKWKLDKREKDNDIIKRPQIQNFSFELKYVISKLLSNNPEERSDYSKYNRNLFNSMPLNCISYIRKLEESCKKNEEEEKGTLRDKSEQYTEIKKHDEEIDRIPSKIQLQQDNSFTNITNIEYDHLPKDNLRLTNSNKDSIEAVDTVKLIESTQPKKEPLEMTQDENQIIDLKTNELSHTGSINDDEEKSKKHNNDNNSMKIKSVSSFTDHDITMTNNDEYDCITILRGRKSDILFKPKEKSYSSRIMNNSKDSFNEQLSNPYHNSIDLFEENSQQQQPQPISRSLSKKSYCQQGKLHSHKMIDKIETLISEIDSIDINEKNDISIDYPIIYHKKPNELNSKATKMYFTSNGETQRQQNENESSTSNDNIVINELSDMSEDIQDIDLSNENKIKFPKRQSKIYKFKNDSCRKNSFSSSISQSSDQPITIQYPSISSLPTESSTASVIIIQAQRDKMSKRSSIREPKRYIKQNSLSIEKLQKDNNSINESHHRNSEINYISSVPFSSNVNDLITFNNINISNGPDDSLNFNSNKKEPLEFQHPSLMNNSKSIDDNLLSPQQEQVSIPSQIIVPSFQSLSSNFDDTHIPNVESNKNCRNEKDVKETTPRPSVIDLFINESIRNSNHQSLPTIKEISEFETSLTKPKKTNDSFGKVDKKIISIPYSASNDSIDTNDAISSQDEYNPSSSSSRKGCYNYHCCYSNEIEPNQIDQMEEKESDARGDTKKESENEKLNKAKSKTNPGDMPINDIILPIKNVTEKKVSSYQKKGVEPLVSKKEKQKKAISNTEDSDHFVHRRVKKMMHPSAFSSNLFIPSLNSLDFDNEIKTEHEIIAEPAITEMDTIYNDDEKMDVLVDIPSITYISSMKLQSSIHRHHHHQKRDIKNNQKQFQRKPIKNQIHDEEVNDFIHKSKHDHSHTPSKAFHPLFNKDYPRNEFNNETMYNNATLLSKNEKTEPIISKTNTKSIHNEKTNSNCTIHSQTSSLLLSNHSQFFDTEISSSQSSSLSFTSSPNKNSYDSSDNYYHYHHEPDISISPASSSITTTEKINSNSNIFSSSITSSNVYINNSGQQPLQHHYPYKYSNTYSNKMTKQQRISPSNDTKKHNNFSASSTISFNLDSILHDTNLKKINSISSNNLEKEIEEILSTSDEEDYNPHPKYSYIYSATKTTNPSNQNSSQKKRGQPKNLRIIRK
ncbi:hypothetical protein BCR36DRAFT_409607 [Piromyces finnis]|uniref:Protein kinase domain-containing protein n=1 Tax=Piromyces finnis TaxID=1754191 RepID=A0A1Y1VKI0_9FUNG|nr:hypothetical protein BCR36DRAFT_409607 [Piromyces finnis]|eukprot:ORX57300.1 hypothetical protein BCR36DRAFT_409607 [Piromyces finnis]